MGDREGGFLGSGGSRKDKKKQVKDGRDRLKQAEKKKRRLEKALANAAAIRLELEKKKQKRKEEEQRLDKEGAALAEAVALQVLVDEDSDAPDELKAKHAISVTGTDFAQILRQIPALTLTGLTDQTRDMIWMSFWSDAESGISRGVEFESIAALMEGDTAGLFKEISCSAEGKTKERCDRAKAAEVEEGPAAAQPITAVGISKEVEVEAPRRIPQAAKNVGSKSIERERDELKARLEYTEWKLREKTKQVSELEHELEQVTQYLMELKAMFESSNEEPGAFCGDIKWRSPLNSRHDVSTR